MSYEKKVEILSALANRTRLKILEILLATQKPIHIEGIARMLNMDYASVYRHVDRLKRAGILGVHEVGRSRVPYVVKREEVKNFLEILDTLL